MKLQGSQVKRIGRITGVVSARLALVFPVHLFDCLPSRTRQRFMRVELRKTHYFHASLHGEYMNIKCDCVKIT